MHLCNPGMYLIFRNAVLVILILFVVFEVADFFGGDLGLGDSVFTLGGEA